MKTAFGKLSALTLALLMCLLLLAPMRAGVEDSLTVNVESVTLDPGEEIDVFYRLEAETAQTVVYSSDAPRIAEVDQRGRVTAVAPGSTTVRLRAQGGATAQVSVTVRGVPLTSITLNTELLELEKGEISGLSCIFNDGVEDQRVSWLSANPEIVRVDSLGRVTAVGAGETYVIAATPGGLSAAATVRVNQRSTAVHIVPAELTIGVGAVLQLETSYLPEDATDRPTEWFSSDRNIVTVDANGKIRAVSAGEAKITVKTEDGRKNTARVVVESAAKDFQLNPTEMTIERGAQQSLEAWFFNADGTRNEEIHHHINWSSDNPDVATVEDGVVTGISTGVTEIRASADGYERACTVRVQTTVREIELSMTEQYLLREQTNEPFHLRATVVPMDADDVSLTYSTNNPAVAGVSADGLVSFTGGYGTAVITAKAAGGAEATFTVHVVTELPGIAAEEAVSMQEEIAVNE